ncbi:MAG TPA: DUF222 domain-containing protein [Jiangellaceae bacterium]
MSAAAPPPYPQGSGTPDEPGVPDEPGTPEDRGPDEPGAPDEPGTPDEPGALDGPGAADEPGGSDEPGTPVPVPEELGSVPPGAVLAGLLEELDVETVSGQDTVEVMGAEYRQLCRQQARFYRAVLETGLRKPFSISTVQRVTRPGEFAAEEARAALVWSRARAERTFGLAVDLFCRLPALGEAMLAGTLDEPRARAFIDWTSGLTDAQAGTVCDQLLPEAAGLMVGELIDRIKRACLAIDPDWAEHRYREAVRTRRVHGSRNPDGTANLGAYQQPIDRIAAASDRIDTLARACKHAGDRRPIDLIRSDLFLGMTDGTYEAMTENQIIAHVLAHPYTEPTNRDNGGEDGNGGRGGCSGSGGGAGGGEKPGGSDNGKPGGSDDTKPGGEPGGTATGDGEPGDTSSDQDGGPPPDNAPGNGRGGSDNGKPGGGTPGDGEPGTVAGDGEPGDTAGDTAGGGAPSDGTDEQSTTDVPGGGAPGDPGGSPTGEATASEHPVGDDTAGQPADDQTASEDQAARGDDGPTADQPTDIRRPEVPAGAPVAGGSAEAETATGDASTPTSERSGTRWAAPEVRIELGTLLGIDEHPGQIPPWGYLPADLARRLVDDMHSAEWRYLFCDPTGRPTAGGLLRARPVTTSTSSSGNSSGGEAMRRDPRRGGIVEIAIPASHLGRIAAAQPPTSPWRPVLIELARHAEQRGRDPNPGTNTDTDARGADTGDAGRRTAGAVLRRWIQLRDRQCVHPCCRAPARTTDQDHRIGYAQGGPTDAANLSTPCRHDHRLKDEGGWTIHQIEPGLTVWTSPLGHHYQSQRPPVSPPVPEPYPDDERRLDEPVGHYVWVSSSEPCDCDDDPCHSQPQILPPVPTRAPREESEPDPEPTVIFDPNETYPF